MNIGINARFLLDGILQGIGRYTWETTKRMTTEHPEDTFFLFFDRPYPEHYIIAENMVPVVVNPPARHPFLFYLWFESGLPKAIDEHRIDVFYSPDNFMSLALVIPTVLVIHDLAYLEYPQQIKWLSRLYYRHFIPKFIDSADHIITVSQYVKSDILSHFDIPKDKITVGYNALPERNEDTNNETFEFNHPYFLFVGTLSQRKNVDGLIRAFERVHDHHPEFRLVLVGKKYNLTHDTSKKLQELIQLGIVVHLSYVTDAQLPSIYKGAFALAYVSLFEGFGIPLLEAMHYKIPILTANVSSLPEVAGEAALLVDPKDINDIARAMLHLINSPQVVQSLVSKGTSRLADFNWKDTADHIYRKIIAVANHTRG